MIKRRRWAAGWNIPGCLPDGDIVSLFDTAEEAWAWVNEERTRAAEDFGGENDPYSYWVESRDENDVSCKSCGAGKSDDCYDDCPEGFVEEVKPLPADRQWIVMVEGDFAVYGPFHNATEAVGWAILHENATTIRALISPEEEWGQ